MSGAQFVLRRGGDSWREYFDQQVERFQAFDEGSNRPPTYVVDRAKEVAERSVKVMAGAVPQLIVAATSEGGIQLKWSRSERELSFVVSSDYTMDYLFHHAGQNLA
jgi:predicted ATPase